MQILTEPKNALVKQYQRLFEMEDVRLTHHPGRARRPSPARPSSARPVRAACAPSWKAILLDTMFELPGLKGVEEVVIGPEVVEGGARPLRIYSDRAGEKGSSA